MYRPVWPTGKIFCDQTFNETGRKENSALDKASKWASHLRYSCSYQVSSSVTQDKKESDWNVFFGLLCIFQIYIDEIIETT